MRSKAKNKRFVCIASRRLGKSTLGFTICCEEAIKTPGSNILFITPVNKNVDRYVVEIAGEVLRDCPAALRPELLPQKAIYKFPNGSQIFCVGSSNQSYENLRGTRVKLAVIDESQRMEDLEIIVDEVIMPSLLDSDGYLLMFGTVPRQPNHPWMRRYVREAERDGAFAEFDIYQANYPPDRVAFFRKQVSQDAWDREFLCKRNADKKFKITPNFDKAKHVLRGHYVRPDYFPMLVSYTGMDIGGALDQTHEIFSTYDAVRKKLVIWSEAVWMAQDSRVDQIAKLTKEKEKTASKKILRVCDTNNFILMKELQEKHRVRFDPVQKGPGSLEAMLEILNIWIENDKIEVDPSCKVLISEFDHGSWNKSRTDFARSEGNHCDGLIAVAYILTIVNERYSVNLAKPEEEEMFIPPPKDPLDMVAKKPARKDAKEFDESFLYEDDVTSKMWSKDLGRL